MPNQSFNLFDHTEKEISEILVKRVGKDVMTFFLKSFSEQGYYYNNIFTQWIPKQRYDGKPTLYDTGKLKTNFVIKYPEPTIFEISVPLNKVPYAGYLQDGTETMVARPFLYDDKKIHEVIRESILINLAKEF